MTDQSRSGARFVAANPAKSGFGRIYKGKSGLALLCTKVCSAEMNVGKAYRLKVEQESLTFQTTTKM
jgi:hypothetical protein